MTSLVSEIRFHGGRYEAWEGGSQAASTVVDGAKVSKSACLTLEVRGFWKVFRAFEKQVYFVFT